MFCLRNLNTMKFVFLIAAAMLLTCSSKAQLIANDGMNIVYRNLPNAMTIADPGYTCKSLIVEASSGKLQKDEGMDCHYIYTPDTARFIAFKISVKTKKGFKTIGGGRFRVWDLPNPEARVASKSDGTVQINILKAQEGMIARMKPLISTTLCADFKIDNFNYAIIRNEKVIANGKNSGNVFDKTIRMYFSSIEDNDTILFYNIYCKGPDGISRKLESFELTAVK
jgi:hypothetical protein